jgi:hypothetical protein
VPSPERRRQFDLRLVRRSNSRFQNGGFVREVKFRSSPQTSPMTLGRAHLKEGVRPSVRYKNHFSLWLRNREKRPSKKMLMTFLGEASDAPIMIGTQKSKMSLFADRRNRFLLRVEMFGIQLHPLCCTKSKTLAPKFASGVAHATESRLDENIIQTLANLVSQFCYYVFKHECRRSRTCIHH